MSKEMARRDAAEAWKTIIVIALLAVGAALLGGCTAAQRGWCHDNLPVIGEFFAPFVPVPKPLWMVAINFVANLFSDHPVESTAVTASVAAVIRERTHGIPGTLRAARLAHKRTASKAAHARMDAEALAKKTIELRDRLERKRATAVVRQQKAKDLSALKDKMAAMSAKPPTADRT